MKNSKTLLALTGRVLPLALIVAAGATFASPVLAASRDSHKSVPMHTTSATSGGTRAADDHPVPPKPKPKRHGGHHRKHPPHPAAVK